MTLGLKGKLIAKSLKPLLKQAGLPEDFMERVASLKLTGFDIDPVEETMSVYFTIRVRDKESLDSVVELGESMINRLKEMGDEGNE